VEDTKLMSFKVNNKKGLRRMLAAKRMTEKKELPVFSLLFKYNTHF
jgi:hypothetical protein